MDHMLFKDKVSNADVI